MRAVNTAIAAPVASRVGCNNFTTHQRDEGENLFLLPSPTATEKVKVKLSLCFN